MVAFSSVYGEQTVNQTWKEPRKELLFDFQQINRQINEGVGNFVVEFIASSDLTGADGLKWKVANDQNVFKRRKHRSEIRQQVFVRGFFCSPHFGSSVLKVASYANQQLPMFPNYNCVPSLSFDITNCFSRVCATQIPRGLDSPEMINESRFDIVLGVNW